jgi:hypothetical protein
VNPNSEGNPTMSPGPMNTAHRGGMIYTQRVGAPVEQRLVPRACDAPAGPPSPAPAHQGRGGAALGLADAIAARHRALLTREDVTPEMEPESPSLTTDEPDEDFDDNEDVTDELEPFDPSIESSLKATVTGDDTEVTITADEGETIVAVTEDDDGSIEVDIEDDADLALVP